MSVCTGGHLSYQHWLNGYIRHWVYAYLGVVIANDRVEAERRVSLTACLLMAFGVGACAGPLLAGTMMQFFGGQILYLFLSLCGVSIAGISWLTKNQPVITVDAPLPHVVMPDSLTSSPLAAALNPTLNEEAIQSAMIVDSVVEKENEHPINSH